MNKKIKSILWWGIPLVIVLVLVAWLFSLPKKSDAKIISRSGIHTHPTIFVSINGENITVPGSIGLGGLQRSIHTHEPDNVLHVEKSGTVRERDVTVGNFFEIWGEDFSSISILGYENGSLGTVRMLVNGEENFEFENYQMRDRDRIEIVYE